MQTEMKIHQYKLLECTNTTPTQHVTDSYKRQKGVTERNKTYKGHHSREDKRKMVREEEAWTVLM